MGESEKRVTVIGVDESEHSFYTLQWTLDHFFSSHSQSLLKIVVVQFSESLGQVLKSSVDVLPILDADLKKTAARTINKDKEMCKNNSVEDAQFEIMEDDPRVAMCYTVERLHASILVLGSHGYGLIKRAILGSVSDH